jgi:hypothetical protein
MTRTALHWAVVGVFGVVLMGGSARGEPLVLTANRTHAIVDPSGGARFLIAFPSVESLEDEWISNATLEVPFSGRAISRDLVVRVDLLDRAWSTSSTWTSPWERAGGDLNGVQELREVLRAGSTRSAVSLDVTHMVRAGVERRAPWWGFALYPSDSEDARGFDAAERELFGALAGATLTIRYRDLSALGRRGGAAAQVEKRRSRAQRQ